MSIVAQLLSEIKSRARQQGLADGDLARRAGISPEALSRLGKAHGARVDTLEALARVVGLRLALLPADDHAKALADGTLFDLSQFDE